MSPSWRNRLCIAISPEHISLLKFGRGLKPKLQANYDVAVFTSGTSPLWRPALDELTKVLNHSEWKNANVDIILSNRLARFTTTTFGPQLSTYSLQEAFAKHYMSQKYGTTAETWDLRFQHGKTGSDQLISAVDLSLLEELRKICLAQRLKLNTVAPYLMPAFNRYRKTIKADPAWLVINEPGYSLFALLSKGEFIAVNGVRHSSMDELPMLLDRENLVCPLTESCNTIYLLTSSDSSVLASTKTGYEYIKLYMTMPDKLSSIDAGLYAMAASVI
jgi:hypothetical protein